MKKVDLLNLKGEKVKELKLNENVFDITPNDKVLYSIRAVQWVGGGNYGTPVPRDYSKKQNRKERKLALKTALTEKANDKELVVVENITMSTPKTKDMVELLKTLKLDDKKVLIIVKEFEENLILASRNLQNVVLIAADEVNVLDLVATNMVLITEDALNAIEEVLA